MRNLLFCLAALFFAAPAFSQSETDTLSTASGLRYWWHVKSNGKPATVGSKVQVHYIGRFVNGTIFETTHTTGAPMKFKLGDGSVLKGWEEVLQLMSQGDKLSVLLPAPLAYGEKGVPNPDNKDEYIIPPNTPLIFEIELEKVR